MSLDAEGTYQGYGFENESRSAFQHGLREQLRTAFEGYLASRNIATFRIGAALDNSTVFGEDGTTNTPSYQYDWRLSTWTGGTVPVRLYGSHQTNNASLTTAPGDGVESDIYGYGVSLNLDGLPKLDSDGYYQVIESTTDGDTSVEKSGNLHGGLYQSSDNTVARATADWGIRSGADGTDLREFRQINADANFRVDSKVMLAAHATGRNYIYALGDDRTEVGNTESSAFVRYQPNRDVNGMVYLQQHRSVLEDSGYGGLSLGSAWSRRFKNGFSGEVDGGATYDEVEENEERATYVGQFARTSISNAQSGAWGLTQVVVSGGVANLTEVGVGSGIQGGGGARVSYGRTLFGMLRANVGALVAAQSDTSTLNDDYVSYGWNAALGTRTLFGVDLNASGSQVRLQQLSKDDGNSDELRATGNAGMRVGAFLRGRYTLTYDRLQLDEEFSEGLGHSVRADLRVSSGVTVSALGYHTTWRTSEFDPTETWRLEGIATVRIGQILLQGTGYRDYYVAGVGEPSIATGVLVELSRRFRWSL